MRKPLFSIIIPTRNRAALLSISIQSVLQQLCSDWELLLIDDGSSDDTASVVAAFADPRIRYIYQEHGERSSARNRGIDLAQGRYICFLDDDDHYDEKYLQAFQTYLEAADFPEIILRTGFWKQIMLTLKRAPNYQPERHHNRVRFVLFHMCGVGSLCIPKTALAERRFPNHIYYWEDSYLFLQLLMQYPMVQLDNHHYYYQQHDESSSQNFYRSAHWLELVDNNIHAMRSFFEDFGKEVQPFVPFWAKNYIVAEKYLDHAISCLPHRNKSDSFRLMIRSLAFPCLHPKILRKYFSWLFHFTFR